MKNRRSANRRYEVSRNQCRRSRASLWMLTGVLLVGTLCVLRFAPTVVRAALLSRQASAAAAPTLFCAAYLHVSMAQQNAALPKAEREKLDPAGGFSAIAYGVTANGTLFRFLTDMPASATTIGNLGIVPEAIDFRPGTAQLYAIDVGPTTTQLYKVNTSTAAVTPVGPGFPSQVMGTGSYSLLGSTIGFDFNPRTLQADGSLRIRVVASNGTNLRLNSDTGLVAAVDTPLQYATGDTNEGQTPMVDAVAYINTAAATPAANGTTLLYDIDFGTDDLTTQNPVNNGTLNTVGPFGVTVDALPGIGFDIFSTSTTDDTNDDDLGFAVFTRPFVGDGKQSATDDDSGRDVVKEVIEADAKQAPNGSASYILYDVNLDTGQVTNGRLVGGGLDFTGGFAVQPEVAAINLVKTTNGTDNNTPPGPTLLVGSTAFFSYFVSNIGSEQLDGITVVDDNGTPGNTGDDFNPTFFGGDNNNNGILDPNETWQYEANRTVTPGQYTNTATATGDTEIILPEGAATTVSDTDVDNHFGGTAAINLVKLTNGTDNNSAPGPTVPVGSTVTFTYIVTNPGTFPLVGVTVRDDNGTPGNMADDFNATFAGGDTNANGQLDTNETWTFTASRIATAGQYTNTGTARGFIQNNETPITDTDVDNHFGGNPNITISINDVSQAEGNTGAGTFTPFNFTVSLSAMSSQTITVKYQTANGTAFAAEDLLPASGTLIFNPGDLSKTVTVLVNAETLEATDENFFVNLSMPTNATIADGQGLGTIINDDASATKEPLPPNAFAITGTNQLLTFNVAAPNFILSRVPITGMINGEGVLGIDFRPATGELYGFTSYNRLVVINQVTGAATVVAQLSIGLNGGEYGVDFNPTNGLLRIVNDADQNAAVDPTNGVVTLQTPLNPGNPTITGVAYTNNNAGAASTTLYDIDSATDTLYIQNPPASGTLTAVGPLGVDTGNLVGFDITPVSAIGYASLSNPNDNAASLYAFNLATGQALLIGQIGTEPNSIRDISISTIPAPVFIGLTPSNKLVTFNPLTPQTVSAAVPITGLINGEVALGIDFRPATGQLFGYTNYNRLITINTTTGAATVLGIPTNLSGIEYGFDFNPTVDRIRVVNDSDQNVRLNPNDGSLTAIDAPLAYAPTDPNAAQNPFITGAAYTNNFNGATSTTLYDIDANLDILAIQNPPNNGTLNTVGPLGFDTSPLVGFDIAAGTGAAYASLQSVYGGLSSLYTINLQTGRATLIRQIGGFEAMRDIAVAPLGTFQFSTATANVAENAGTVTLTVTRTGDTAITAASVSFETVAGTAVSPGDYTATSGTLFFIAGETSKTITIPITDDTTAEPSETFTVRLIGPTSGYFTVAPSTITVTINDND